MRKILFMVCFCSLFMSCDDVEKKGNERLGMAQYAFKKGDYNEAKLQIDSIKILYPKAFKARKEGIKLLQQVELKEQEKSLVYLDSILQQKKKEFEQISKSFAFEKNAEYQSLGNYFYPTQTVERNLHRSFLRFQVSEKGIMSMTSIYCGGRNIHHVAIKVTTTDGSFAQTPSSKDIYETSNLGEKVEKADYKKGEDGGVIDFIYLNKEKSILIDFIGDRKYSIKMQSEDIHALINIYELAQNLSAILKIEKETDEAHLKIKFINKKIEFDKSKSKQ
ncbi:hypothetical protein FQ707_00730 [Bacteroidaceae bacterium HV4-6-C5C]|jgi:hypothetical protein|nr:hypothetical protein FQ707_00730 [Bacteroidaceae bacterium HV4-6-C5C]